MGYGGQKEATLGKLVLSISVGERLLYPERERRQRSGMIFAIFGWIPATIPNELLCQQLFSGLTTWNGGFVSAFWWLCPEAHTRQKFTRSNAETVSGSK